MMGWSRRGWRRAPMKLLLIEDDVRVAWVLAEAFGAEGHETTIRYSGADGLAYLARERPDTLPAELGSPLAFVTSRSPDRALDFARGRRQIPGQSGVQAL